MLFQKAAVGDFLGQRMLEGINGVARAVTLMEQLGGLELREMRIECGFRRIGDEPYQRDREVDAGDRGGLQQVFGFDRQTIDARRECRLHSWWKVNVDRRQRS